MRRQLGGLQLAVMRVLWERGRASVSDVQKALLPSRALAYSTIGTVLGRLEQRGLVSHQVEGRTAVFEPVASEGEVTQSAVSRLVDELFAGSPAELVSHLLERRDIEPEELARIKELIRCHERKGPGAGGRRS